MPKCTYRWRKVSAGDGDVYVPRNVPIEVLGRTFEFRRLESGVEAIVPSNVEGERAGDGNQDGGRRHRRHDEQQPRRLESSRGGAAGYRESVYAPRLKNARV